MAEEYTIPWNRVTCRKIINRLRDGLPPPVEAIEFLSVGYEAHLDTIKAGLEKARQGGYAVTIFEGRYGIGKSHLLSLAEVIAQQRNFVVKRIDVEHVYFNNPDGIYRQILGNERKPGSYEYSRYGPYYRDKVRKFIAGLRLLADRHHKQGATGLVILLDELENTVSQWNLPNFRSRIKAYRFLDALFKGYAGNFDQHGRLRLEGVYVAIAITPGMIEKAINDPEGWWYYGWYEDFWIPNLAKNWPGNLPKPQEVSPLTEEQALELAKRIRAVHARAFDWEAKQYVNDIELGNLCREWVKQDLSRDDRRLVREIVEILELAEQNR